MRFYKAKIISVTMILLLGSSSVASAAGPITIAVTQSKVNVLVNESIQVTVTTVPNNICFVMEMKNILRNYDWVRASPDFNTGPSGIYSFPFAATKAGGFTYWIGCSLTRNGEFALNVSTPTPTPTPTPVVAIPTPTPVVVTPTPVVVTPTPVVVTPTPTPVVVTPTPVVVTPTPVVVTPTPTNTMTDKNGNTLVAPKDISIRCKSMSTKYAITNVTGPNPKCPLNYRLLLPNDPEYNGPIGGVTSTTPVVSPTPTPDSVGTAPIPEYVWCVQSSTGRSVRSVTPYKPSCPKGYTARDYYGIPTDQVITPGAAKPSPSPLIRTVKVCYKSTDIKRVNGVTVFRESVTGAQPICPAGYK